MMRWLIAMAFIVFVPTAVAADIYRSVDKDGKVIYSDRRVPGAEPVKGLGEVPTVQSVKPPPPPPPPERPKPQAAVPYELIEIAAPAHDSTVRDNTGNVAVSVVSRPPVQVEFGHLLTLYLDGKRVDKPGIHTSFQFTNLDRGTHTLRAVVTDGEGREVASSMTSRFHLHRISTKQKKPPAS